jgi:benzoyl-CoA reductase subunit C
MQEWTGNEITDAALDDAIETYNENRRLLRRVYELRREFRAVVLGSEAMNMVLADQVMDKKEMNRILKSFIAELEGRAPGEDRIRLMLIGSETYDTQLEEMVESLGANIVIDELDNGSNYFWNETVLQKDRLAALAYRYLGRPHNPIKDNNWRRRPQRIFELAEDYHVDGAIIAKQINCHLHGTDNYAVWKILRERYIPYHYFERDDTLPKEETELRLEAFLNMLRPGLTRLVGWHQTYQG